MPKGMLPKETLRKLQDAPDSAVFKVPKTLHLAIHPQYLGNIQLGIVNYFNHEMNRFNKELDGILMGHEKIRLKEPKAEVLNEEHYLHLDVHSEFWIFRPQVDSILSGVVNKKSPAHISVLIHGLFNVPCHKNLDLETVWMGSNVSVGSHVKVRILQMDLNQKVPFLLGELYESPTSEELKEEEFDLVLVENIKEEKVWEDITEKDESSCLGMQELEEDSVDVSAHTKKKKKKKKSKKESDQEEPQLASSFLLSPPQKLGFNSTRGDSPILTQVENSESMDVDNESDVKEQDSVDEMREKESPKKKKKKKKHRSPERDEVEEDAKEALSVSLLATLNDATKKKKNKKHKEEDSPSIADKSIDEDKVKEDLSNSLILEMLSKERKSKKKKRKSRSIEDDDETIDIKSNKDSSMLIDDDSPLTPSAPQKEKKSKKRKSLADEILRQTVEDTLAEETKRKRSASESSTSDNLSKKVRLDLSVSELNESVNGASTEKSSLQSPHPAQEPRLPPGWTFTTHGANNRKKTWLSPAGKKFSTLKSANEFISQTKN